MIAMTIDVNFDIIFVDLDGNCVQALIKHFSDVPNITCKRANIGQISDFTRPVAVGSAGNFACMMDGGVDGAINYLLSTPDESIEERCQKAVDDEYYGEQPVGTCILVPSCNDRYDYLAYVPTMRVPEDVRKTLNPYLAFRALLVKVHQHNKTHATPIKTVITSSMCTGAGNVDAEESARQMRLAYESVFERDMAHDWITIWEFQQRLRDEVRDRPGDEAENKVLQISE